MNVSPRFLTALAVSLAVFSCTPDAPQPKSGAIDPKTATILVGGTKELTVKVTLSDDTVVSSANRTDVAIAWTSSDATIATVEALKGAGKVTGVKPGKATITASATNPKDSKQIFAVTAEITVESGAATLTSVEITPPMPSIAKGTTQQFVATAKYSDMTTRDVSAMATWASSDAAIASVDAAGLASGIAVGTSSISAVFEGKTGTVSLAVTAAVIRTIAVTPAMVSLAAGTTQQLTATGTFSDMTTQDITSMATWTSSAASVTVNDAAMKGLATGASVGSADITAAFGGKMGSVTIAVTAATLSSIAVTPAAQSIALGTTKQYVATGTFSDGTNQDISAMATWSSSTAAVASVSASGLATALTVGTTNIVAAFNGKMGQSALTVTAATLVSIAVTPASPSIAKGLTQQFTATGTYSNATTQNITTQVTWSSATAATATISNAAMSNGLATSVNAGTTVISATLGMISGMTTLTVTNAALVSISVTPATPSIAKGRTQQFTATGTYSDNSTQNVTTTATWSSATVATATIAPATGLATAVNPGTSIIRATIGAISGTTTLTVTNATLVSISVTPATPSIAKGRTQQFTATGTYSDNSNQDVTAAATWSSATLAAATIAPSTGLATAVNPGTSVITATVGAVSGSTTLTVTNATLVSISVSPATPTIPKGRTQQFTATGTFTDNSTADITSTSTWSSATAATATIAPATGLASSVNAGTSLITATQGTISGSTTLTVTNATLVSIAVTPANPSIPKGRTQQFTATGTFTDNSTQDVTATVAWSSATTATATIASSTGLASSVNAGTSVITAAVGTISASTTLTVTNATLVSISLTPASPSIPKGRTQQFTATGTFTDNSTADVTATASWSSATTATATIAPATGLASSVNPGTTVITAAVGAISASTILTVTNATLVSISVSPVNPSIPNGQTQQFVATGTFTDGSSSPIAATWSSATTATATINPSTGLASSANPGNTVITASLGAVSATTTLTVTAATLVSISISPATASIANGRTQQYVATGTFTDGSNQVLTNSVTWTSVPGVAASISNSVATKGLATGLAVGSTQIGASLGAIVATTRTLNVTAAVLVSLSVSPSSASVALGTSRNFTANGVFSDNSNADLTSSVTWTPGTPSVATISNAVLTKGQATSLSVGSTTITASLGAISSAPATLTVTGAVLASINVSPSSPSLPVGISQQFVATGVFTDGSTQILTTTATWASSGTFASISNVSGSKGLATAQSVGSVTITATSGTIVGSTTLTVNNATLASIQVTPGAPSIPLARTQQFAATGTYSNSQTFDITQLVNWGSSAPLVAPISNADGSRGLANGLAQGTSLISATLNSVSNAVNLEVTAAALVSIAVTPGTTSMARGTGSSFIATGTYTDSTTRNITQDATWTSADATKVSVQNAPTGGVLSGVNVTTAPVTITASLDGKTGTATASVTSATLVSINVTRLSASIADGTSTQFTATGTYTDSTTQDLTATASWSSDAPLIASVSSTGLVTGEDVGLANITASVGPVSGTNSITVTSATLVRIDVTPLTASIARGTQQQFVATGVYTNGTTQNLSSTASWNSATTATATVSSVGLASALNIGTSVISASSGTITGTATLTVTAATLVSIAVNPSELDLPAGLVASFTATGTYTDSTTQNITTQVLWASSLPAAATVSNAAGSQGVVSTLAPGLTSISATLGSVVGSNGLSVNNATLVSIGVTPPNQSLPRGTALDYSATGVFSNSSTFDLTNLVTWGAVNTSFVSISNAAGTKGRASGLNVGATSVFATYRSVTGTTPITVTAATLVSLSVSPNSVSVPVGLDTPFAATGTFTDGSSRDITNDVTWSSGSPNASISNAALTKGVATGVTVGTGIVITATAGMVTNTATLNVTNAVLVSIQVTASNAVTPRGLSRQFTATGVFSDATTQPYTTQVTWTSSALTVMTISNAGGSEGLAFAANTGTTIVTATAGTISGTANHQVTSAVLTSIAVTPNGTTNKPKGLTQAYVATGTFSDATTQILTTSVTWAAASMITPAPVSISNAPLSQGVASADNVGLSIITATLGTVTSPTVVMNVTSATLVSIAVTPASVTVAKGFTQQFVATGTFTDLSTQVLTSSATWAASAPSIVFVSNSLLSKGLATALNPGVSNVTATVGTVVGTASMTVTNAVLVSLTLSRTPTTTPVPVSSTQQWTAIGNYSDASTSDLTTQVTWTSSNTAVAEIQNVIGAQGLSTALSNGATTITAQAGAISANQNLTVGIVGKR
jgi:uncharacterized protein YjdB